ncbi:dimethylamine monooxygenase subunit DmmA family protein [Novosphingobium acidiphilum]|uniref:dimethylamine monooxygenase subunit DmmA family protein n=1 Tax=Novosphingobium acidiphilum TaxID=505248 RepID=UPI000424285C|nr:dimethylamine monooxygenase subunit DmmA family protein [Novosphingobium acidiphilum]
MEFHDVPRTLLLLPRMVAPMSNRPRYAPLMPVAGARAHLLVTDHAVPAAQAFDPRCSENDFAERWTVVAHAMVLPQPFGGPGVQHFRSASHLLALLRHRLGAETMGLRLYVAGSEPFVWDAARVAFDAGMGREELHLFACGQPLRRVWCVHCRTVNPGVTTTVATCAGCGVSLSVRDHFSRAQNAWMGVQCDAEVPGDVPAIKDLSA